MMTFRRFLLIAILIGVASALLLRGPAWSSPTDKISIRVLKETANGGTTEALIVLREQADVSRAATFSSKIEKGRYVVNTLREVANRTQEPVINLLRERGVQYQAFYIVNMIKITGDRKLMEELAAREDVAQIDANPYVRTALPQPTRVEEMSAGPSIEWNLKKVQAPQVWNLGFHGEGLVVAGADTGVQWDHPALKAQYRGWNGQQADHDYNWHDATPDHSPTPIDPYGHGTFTVSEMSGYEVGIDVLGVAPGAKWIACRNMDSSGTGSPARYTECFQFLIAPYPIGGDPSQGDPTKAPDSVNNSWICPPSEGCSTNTLLKIVNNVRAAGIFPAMAASNSGPGCSTVTDPPAIYAASVSVGATDINNNVADFSSRGPVTVDGSNRLKPELSAPGVNVRGAIPTNSYGEESGTSMAAPHLAGGVALIWQAKPKLDGDITGTEKLLAQTALHLKSSQNCGGSGQKIPNNVFGYGLISLYNAVKAP